MSKTGFIFDPIFLKHNAGDYHPERPERLESILQYMRKNEMWDRVTHISPVRADLKWIETIHGVEYIDYVASAFEQGITRLDPDTGISKDSYDAALKAVGAGIAAVDAVMSGDIANAFCAVRPPGHHAEADIARGFCLFNNIAIAARYVQVKHELERVLILDWDAHHGNGTQHSFDDDPSVFYISLHQYPYFPGTGAAHERGVGAGAGTILNIPLQAGTTDDVYLQKFESNILPAINSFRPQFILISAGFDAHEADPLCGLSLSTACFGTLTELLLCAATSHCEGRLVSILEGGYDLAALAQCVGTHLQTMMEYDDE